MLIVSMKLLYSRVLPRNDSVETNIIASNSSESQTSLICKTIFHVIRILIAIYSGGLRHHRSTVCFLDNIPKSLLCIVLIYIWSQVY